MTSSRSSGHFRKTLAVNTPGLPNVIESAEKTWEPARRHLVIGIAEAEDLANACAQIAPEMGLSPRASETALRVALREADHLSDDVYDVPGALLFSFGRTRRCFAAFRSMSVLAIEWHVKTMGFKLEASREELAEILERVARREMEYADVRAWTAQRLLPFGG